MFQLDGKVAVVTGSGRGSARRWPWGSARRGAQVVVCSRTRERGRISRADRTEGLVDARVDAVPDWCARIQSSHAPLARRYASNRAIGSRSSQAVRSSADW